MSEDNRAEFAVVEFFYGDTSRYVQRWLTAKEAVQLASDCSKLASRAPTSNISRIIITDGGDNTVFEWVKGKGITYPPENEGWHPR